MKITLLLFFLLSFTLSAEIIPGILQGKQEVMIKSNPALGERIRLGLPKAVKADREGIPLEIALGAK